MANWLRALLLLTAAPFSISATAHPQFPSQWPPLADVNWPEPRTDDADGTFYIGFPVYCTPECPPRRPLPKSLSRQVIHLVSKDAVYWEGELVTNGAYRAKLQAASRNRDGVDIAFAPSPNMRIDDVIDPLAVLNRSGVRYVFVGNEAYRKIDRALATNPLIVPDTSHYPVAANASQPVITIGATDPKGLEPGAPGYSGPSVDGQCRIYWMREMKPINSDELLGLTARMFMAFVDKLPSDSESVFKKEIGKFGAYLRYSSGTPFRCVGGVISIVASTGSSWAALAAQPLPPN